MMVEKKACFFYKFIMILAKDNNRVYKKKHFHVIFGFFGWELILDYVINTKRSNLAFSSMDVNPGGNRPISR